MTGFLINQRDLLNTDNYWQKKRIDLLIPALLENTESPKDGNAAEQSG